MIKIFLSYSYDSEKHEEWVTSLAYELEQYKELHVIYDKYDLSRLDDKNYFMEKGVFGSDYIVVIASENYVKKSNNREGGVGIETYMASSRYWEETLGTEKDNVIVILRDNAKKELPNYLKGKIYIDFNEDRNFPIQFQELLKVFKADDTLMRPSKIKILEKERKQFDFSQAEELIAIIYKQRTQLEKVVDFSSGRRIKYEYWEVRNPFKLYILILFDNISIKDTIEHFLERNTELPPEITVLRSISSGYIEKVFSKLNKTIKVIEFSFSDFIWDMCIDEDAKKVERLFEENYFIDQKLYRFSDGEKHVLDYCIPFIKKEFLEKNESEAILFLLASGGMGKSTLCHIIANDINRSSNRRSILIQSESIKRHGSQDFFENFVIESIYDLYDVYSKITKIPTGFSSFQDKRIFDLSLLCGNIVVIIDGLDEIISLFQENFNVDSFFESLALLNRELGKSSIIITSREYYWKDHSLIDNYMDDIIEVHLLGFDEEVLSEYLEKRFRRHPRRENCIELANKQIKESEFGNEGIMVPFFVDVISQVVQDEFEGAKYDSTFDFSKRNYRSNDALVDYMIYVLLNREIERQAFNITLNDFINIFIDIASEYNGLIKKTQLEELSEYYFNTQSDSIYRKMLLNPLLFSGEDSVRFKYDFLSNYFVSLYLIKSILESSESDIFIHHMSRLYDGKNQIFNEVMSYFRKSEDDLLSCVKLIVEFLVNKYKKLQVKSERTIIEKAISALMYLVQEVLGKGASRERRMELICEIYASQKIHYLFIWGEFYPLDFTDIKFWDSKFYSYSNFGKCKFTNAEFYYCDFEEIDIQGPFKDIKGAKFDSTCHLNTLSEVVLNDGADHHSKGLLEKELKKYFRSFYERGSFKNKVNEQITYSQRSPQIDKKFSEYLVSIGLLKFDSSGKRYSISHDFQRSVHNFIINDLSDRKINKIQSYLVERN